MNAEQIRILAVVLDAANAISAERGPANVYMAGQSNDGSPSADRWAAAQATTDAALRAAAQVGVPANSLAAVHSQLSVSRKAVTSAAQKPMDTRRSDEIQFAIDEMFMAWDTYQTEILVPTAFEISSRAPETNSSVLRATTLNDIRDKAGRIGSYLIGAMATQEKLSDVNLEKIRLLRHQLDLYSRALAPAMLHATSDFSVRQKVFHGPEHFFALAIQLVDSEIAQSVEKGRFAMDVEGFTARYAGLLEPLSELRNADLALTVATYDADKRQAHQALLRDSIITLALLALLLGLFFNLRTRLLRPLLLGVEDVVALSQGRRVQTRLHQTQFDEVADLFKAISVLREKIEERAELMRQVEQSAKTDQLTGVLNRRGFEQHCRDMCPDDLSPLILIDIDHFKAVNDQYGHPVGDQVLRQFAQTMVQIAGEDVIVGRLGGEEFAIMCKNRTAGSAVRLARNLKKRFERYPLDVDEHQRLRITASFGVSTDVGLALSAAMKCADEALYRAKRDGRNRVRISRSATPRNACL
ncbi:GGDEF domain-containing protein [Rhizobium sp. SL86]|nr:GGDEF domain-containing protein [Rhizobium sp. SL86]MCY1667626.1 GGDEF domain-containing protein [Rhizobium sp. SL86]